VETRPVPISGIGSVIAFHKDRLFLGAPLAAGCSNESWIEYIASRGHDPPGAVFEFELAGGRWRERRCLEPLMPERGHFFGSSLAVTDRVLAVSYPGAKDVARGIQRDGLSALPPLGQEEYVGAVQLYPRDADGNIDPNYFCVIKSPNAGSCDVFGNSVV